MKRQDAVGVRTILQQKIDVNAPDGDGASALHWAVHWDDAQTAEMLIRRGAAVNATNPLGVTPLYLACTNGSDVMVRLLLRAGADPNIRTSAGASPLMQCALTGKVGAVDALLARGADTRVVENAQAQTALMWAASEGHADVVQRLVAAGADVHARTTVTSEAVTIGRFGNGSCGVPCVTVDLKRGGSTALMLAARNGHIESVRALLAGGARADETYPDGNTALTIACHGGHADVAALLLEWGADPNASAVGYTALHLAVLRADRELVTMLLSHHADPNARITQGSPTRRWAYGFILPHQFAGATPLFLAARYAEAEILALLGAAGGRLDVALPDGTTPLMAAAGVGWPDLVTSVNVTDRRGRTVAFEEIKAEHANEQGTLDAVAAIVTLGADVNTANVDGSTALHGAALQQWRRVFDYLVEHGARADLVNKKGETAAQVLARISGKP